jgi:hypothetical protein
MRSSRARPASPSTATTRQPTITDLKLAPANRYGEVEFSADIYLLKPVDLRRGNGTALLEINNRGRKGMLSMFNRAAGSLDPSEPEHFGDGLLLEQGYTLVWVGWQHDPPPTEHLMHLFPAVAQGRDGKPLRGLARADFVKTDREFSHSLADRDHIAYSVADPDAAENVLTVRDDVERPARSSRARSGASPAWKTASGSPMPGASGWKADLSRARSTRSSTWPKTRRWSGLGMAAVRDFISYLKYDSAKP